ncbi:putative penicillin-binding protein [Streptomyces sp. NBRC 110611]|uniref:transglycosylase domain-containing protein n=1 Tax=Streptomyces sp. NBRC 110611 TaxID=1621259 RepID=UPI000833E92C|nr:transglycosylase domain-containing protein [Streptomyces sp. NBRC 110611]GAU65207.1 putative penicillin-binding protein [Streptomyces sp. NBRC 110611]
MGRAEARRARQGSARRAKQATKRTKQPGKKSGIRRFFTWKKLLGAFLGVCLLGILGFVGLYLTVDVPKVGNEDATLQSNIYRYSDGTIMARRGEVNRETVALDKIPEKVQHAFVAAENKTFYTDSGVDLKGTARGILNTLMGKGKQGGSTITQQYVKNYYLTQEQTVSRKLQEIVISLKADNKYDKDDILAGYLNTSFYGRNAYGIQAAAHAYYGVDVDKLTVSQGAYLAALLQAPNQYDWDIASEAGRKRVQERWAYALDNMVEMGWLTPEERKTQKFQIPIKTKPDPGLKGQSGYLIKAAKDELISKGVDAKLLARGGYDITLGIDRKKQQALEKSVKEQFTDELDPDKRKVDRDAQLGATSVDPKTGHIVAMYGGAGYTQHYLNNAQREDYQAASTFKPLILAAAMEGNAVTQDGRLITPNTIYNGDNKRPVKGSTIPYAPENEDHVDYGQISVQKATEKSVNSVFAQMGVDAGLGNVKKLAGRLGMTEKKIDATPAMSLGSMGASTQQMAGVYAAFANHGKVVAPALVVEAKRTTQDNVEEKVQLKDPIGEQVLDRKTADTMTSVLTGVVNEGGTGRRVVDAATDIAGKTGTSDDNKSAWFVGYTPKLVTAVGIFGEGAKGSQVKLYGVGGKERIDGGYFPALVWSDYTQSALGSDADAEFELETNLGAGVAPPPTTPSKPTHTPSTPPTPTRTPSSTPSPTRTPSSSPPSPPPSPSRTPSSSPPVPPTGGTEGGTDSGGTSSGTTGGGDGGTGGQSTGGQGGSDSLPNVG